MNVLSKFCLDRLSTGTDKFELFQPRSFRTPAVQTMSRGNSQIHHRKEQSLKNIDVT